jgi:hypothetical protein
MGRRFESCRAHQVFSRLHISPARPDVSQCKLADRPHLTALFHRHHSFQLRHRIDDLLRYGLSVIQSAAINRRSRCGSVRGCPVPSSHFSLGRPPQVGQRTACTFFRVSFLDCMTVDHASKQETKMVNMAQSGGVFLTFVKRQLMVINASTHFPLAPVAPTDRMRKLFSTGAGRRSIVVVSWIADASTEQTRPRLRRTSCRQERQDTGLGRASVTPRIEVRWKRHQPRAHSALLFSAWRCSARSKRQPCWMCRRCPETTV